MHPSESTLAYTHNTLALVIVTSIVFTGIGEAGKSTFIKQMKVIHGGGYSDEERLKYKQQIYQNVYTAIHNLTHAMTKLRVSYKSDETKVTYYGNA